MHCHFQDIFFLFKVCREVVCISNISRVNSSRSWQNVEIKCVGTKCAGTKLLRLGWIERNDGQTMRASGQTAKMSHREGTKASHLKLSRISFVWSDLTMFFAVQFLCFLQCNLAVLSEWTVQQPGVRVAPHLPAHWTTPAQPGQTLPLLYP